MKEEFNNHRMDPELEARIVALVLGEASELEREQLNRLVEELPELAAFKSEIEAAHGLMSRVGASEWPEYEKDWKLSPEKRDAVLAVICGESSQATTPSDKKPAIFQFLAKDNARWNFLRIAAAVGGAGVFGFLAIAVFLFSPTVRMARDTSRRFGLEMSSSGKVASLNAKTPAASNGTAWMFDGEHSSEKLVDVGVVRGPVSSQPDAAIDSTSLLSEIRDNLGTNVTLPTPRYVQDDVQYFRSGVEFNLPADAPALPSVLARDKVSRELSGRRESVIELKDGNAAVVPESGQKPQSYTGMVTDEKPGVIVMTDGARGFAKAETEAKAASPGEPITPFFGAPESAPEPGAAQQNPRFRNRVTLDTNGEAAGNANDGFDADHDGDGLPDSVRIDFERRVKMTSNSKEKAQRDKKDDAVVDGRMEIAGDKIEGRRPMIVSGGIAMDSKPLQLHGERYANGIEDAISPSPQDAKGLDNFAETIRVTKRLATEDVSTLRQDAPATLEDVLNREVQENWDVVGQSPSEEAKSEGVDEKKKFDFQTKSSSKSESTELDFLKDSDAVDEPPIMYPDTRQWRELSRRRLEIGKSIESTRGTKAVAASGLNESIAAVDAFSTFSLHVSDVSFKLAQAALARGEWPEAAKVRIEEFVNAFDYGDPMPSDDEKVACCVEQSIHPFLQQRNLLRVSMRTAAAGRASSTPLRITFLLDNSGSMERIDRQQTVRSAFALLAQQLTPIDQVTLISFARQPRLLADKVNGAQSKQLVDLIDELPSEGGTNLEAALKLAMEKATEQQLEGAQNRIVLLTDGAVNLGDANPESLSVMITAMRDAGIAFDAAGISAEGLNDEVLEALTRKGDGRYYLLDSVEAADDGFVRQIAGALRPSAKNVKVQVEFNPKRVGQYKLLGYEKHLLKQEDFRNDNVDAAEMAAAEAGVAVYQFESLPNGEGDVGSVSVRFRDLSTGEMVENRWPIPYEANTQRTDQAAPSMCIATSAAMFASKLRGEPLGEAVDLKTLTELLAGLPEHDRNAKRVQQLLLMINQALQVGGNP